MTITNTPQVSIKTVDDGYIVHIRPRAGAVVYVVSEAMVSGMPCAAITFSEAQHSLLLVEEVREFFR